ncbi:hypothetical protein CGRA01v4_04192 [Colletotrichum graminicola]|nr:hypothetical protein CGRA01v4_04192 [Colletotrichum graminicola]
MHLVSPDLSRTGSVDSHSAVDWIPHPFAVTHLHGMYLTRFF